VSSRKEELPLAISIILKIILLSILFQEKREALLLLWQICDYFDKVTGESQDAKD
jgi:hypothetical protein